MIFFETEAPTEPVTIEYTVPEGMDLSAYVPRNSIILAIASLIIVLAAIIILFCCVEEAEGNSFWGNRRNLRVCDVLQYGNYCC